MVRKQQDPRSRLIVYVVAPEPGRVKPQIAAAIGNRRAAEVYRAILSGFLARLRGLRRTWQMEIHFTPAKSEALLVPETPPGIPRMAQVEGSLGDRLSNSFTTAFQSSRCPVMIVGVDCPDLPITCIIEASRSLATHDAVVGPTIDGGLYLIGLRAPIPGLFEEIQWSDSNLCDIAVKRLKLLGRRCYLSPTRATLETITDVEAFLARLPIDKRMQKMQNRIRAAMPPESH